MTKPINKGEMELHKPDKGDPSGNKDGKKGGPSLVSTLFITSFICAIFVGANYFMESKLMKDNLKNIGADDVDTEAQANKPDKGLILDLGQFTMNLSDTDKRSYLKINVAIEVSSKPEDEKKKKSSGGHEGGGTDPVLAEMEQYRPAIRDAIITIMTSKTSDELSTAAGKELAKQQISDAVNDIFDGERQVMRVSFGDFIMQ